ncbi:LacI family DNA-binding transcriptional regulator [Cellulomonas sp. C5510]|uniref:LacI family DNA-binding transcriptional regulator n=1 Tax=Cellulomonas sp. C5510 TaxID=2871170 RepID=UPI001C9895E4|nr:LacI family DNA-binding transcriptional regulator [Cellulomonas sp. C5510]QZN85403.1 LacI family transcriptional regulator [Cellulomonas sp. C5510]
MTSTAQDSSSSRKKSGRSPLGSTSLAVVAELAGVSEATVSRVLNRKYGVSAATRATVEDALRQVGYERPKNRELVVLLTPNLRNPIFAHQAERIEGELTPHGLKAVICPVYPGSVQEREYVESLIDSGVAAIVFLSSSNTMVHADHRVVQLVASRGLPFVSINGGFDEHPAPVVSSDDWKAADLAVGHLYDLGHRRIGLLAGPVGNIPADRRVEGFVQAMERRGLPAPEDYVVRQHFNFEGGNQAASLLLRMGATGIIGSSDEMALGAYRAVERAGLSVPGDVSVIGYDDSPFLDYTAPPLTTVRQPVELIAENVGWIISSMIQNRPVDSAEILVAPEIRLRGSTAPARDAG